MTVKTLLHPKVYLDQKYRASQNSKTFRRSSLCMVPLIWPHLGLVGWTLLTGLLICMVATQIILADYKCPKCGMQLDYNRSLDEPQSCMLCGKLVTQEHARA